MDPPPEDKEFRTDWAGARAIGACGEDKSDAHKRGVRGQHYDPTAASLEYSSKKIHKKF